MNKHRILLLVDYVRASITIEMRTRLAHPARAPNGREPAAMLALHVANAGRAPRVDVRFDKRLLARPSAGE
jgi:hypothetical protein